MQITVSPKIVSYPSFSEEHDGPKLVKLIEEFAVFYFTEKQFPEVSERVSKLNTFKIKFHSDFVRIYNRNHTLINRGDAGKKSFQASKKACCGILYYLDCRDASPYNIYLRLTRELAQTYEPTFPGPQNEAQKGFFKGSYGIVKNQHRIFQFLLNLHDFKNQLLKGNTNIEDLENLLFGSEFWHSRSLVLKTYLKAKNATIQEGKRDQEEIEENIYVKILAEVAEKKKEDIS